MVDTRESTRTGHARRKPTRPATAGMPGGIPGIEMRVLLVWTAFLGTTGVLLAAGVLAVFTVAAVLPSGVGSALVSVVALVAVTAAAPTLARRVLARARMPEE